MHHGSAQTWPEAANRYPDTYVPVQHILQDDPFAYGDASNHGGERSRRSAAAASNTSADDFVRAVRCSTDNNAAPQSVR